MTPEEIKKDRDKWEAHALRLEEEMMRLRKEITTRQENNFGLHRRNVRLTAALEKIAENPGWMDDEFGFMSGHIARGALGSQNAKSDGSP